MGALTRSRIAVWLVVAALVGWFLIDQVTDLPQETMIGGVVVVALTLPLLTQWIRSGR